VRRLKDQAKTAQKGTMRAVAERATAIIAKDQAMKAEAEAESVKMVEVGLRRVGELEDRVKELENGVYEVKRQSSVEL